MNWLQVGENIWVRERREINYSNHPW
jgi:hypothetical protein